MADLEALEQHRTLLFGIAYRMLGSAADADDIVQEAHVRYRLAGAVSDARAYAVTVVTRLCLDHLKSARVRREEYVGPWLPEPLPTSDDELGEAPDAVMSLRESVSIAFLVLVENLDPVERAALVLHDVFDYRHAEIAAIVGKSEPACRKLLERAREHLAERRRCRVPSRDEQARLTRQFLAAAQSGDLSRFVELLGEGVIAYSDGGGKTAAALHPIRGSERVARFACAFPRKEPTARVEQRELNGAPAVLMWLGARLSNVFTFDFADDKIIGFYVQRNPDKLRRLQDVLAPGTPPTTGLE